MKKRDPLAVCILSIVTMGIYDVVWLVKTKNAMNRVTRTKVPSIWLLFLPLILFTGVFAVTISAQVSAASTHANPSLAAALTVVLGMLVVLAIIPITFYWLWKYSKAVHEYTNGAMNTAVAFLLLWLLRFIGMAIVQDAFNDVLNSSQGPAPAPAMATMPSSQPPAAAPSAQ